MNLDDWLGHIESVHFRSIDLQLDRVSAVLKRILPDGPRFLSISVAGTNGKGTAVEALGSILLETGMRVGLYTSPHLVSYNERIRVGGQEAGDAELCSAFEVIEKKRPYYRYTLVMDVVNLKFDINELLDDQEVDEIRNNSVLIRKLSASCMTWKVLH